VTVSGDGLIHEVVNGIYRRPDATELMKQTTIGFIPGGTANGLVKSVLDHTGEDYGVL
jgi:sphingosine kinase